MSEEGTQLLAGRYQLTGLLGCGGMGEVHRAWDTHLRRYVALKLFPATADATARQRFDTEIHLMAQLSHPNLVSVYDAGDSAGLSFVALQLVDGPTLRDRLAGSPLDPGKTRALGANLADALTHVHGHGVVHRDVKPSNILLDLDGMPYLADFGLARLTGSTRLTKCDEMVGTAAYLAPEQVRGGDIGPSADIYALGLVLLECLTGRREYEGNEIEAAVARLHRPPQVPPTVPEDLARLLTLMTSLTPHRRPSADQCAHALRHPGVDLPAVDTPTATTTVAPARRPRATKRLLLAAAIGALAVTGASLASLNNPQPAVSEPTTPSPAPQQPQPEQAVVTHTTTVVVPAPVQPQPATTPTNKRAGNSGPGSSDNSGSDDSGGDNSSGGKSKNKKPDRPDKED